MIDASKLSPRNGFSEGLAAEVAPEAGLQVSDYKESVVRRYVSLNGTEIESRLGGSTYQVTRKYDGELAVIFFDGTQSFTINTGGRVRTGLAVHDAVTAQLVKAGVGEAIIPAELYVVEDAGRTRVFDVASALANDPSRLRLAPFEIISIDGVEHRPMSYTETHALLSGWFSGEVAPVQMKAVESRAQIAQLYQEWVTEGGAEGLVVRTDLPTVYKVKPVYTLDVAVIGYSENPDEASQVRSLLVALIASDGRYQPVGHVGSGLNDESRTQFHTLLSNAEVPSSYIETDANHVAFHLVRPEIVIEIKVNDVLFESLSGPVSNPLLEFDGQSWSRTGTGAGISIIHPVLVGIRQDKAVNPTDVRLAQIEEYFAWPVPPVITSDAAPASTLLRREVYTKGAGGKIMVQKFLAWATNKADRGYAEYVVAYVNFSSGRKDPLSTEVRISASSDQALAMFDALVADKVKSGWQQVGAEA